MNRWKETARNGALVLGSIAFCLLLLEAGLSVYYRLELHQWIQTGSRAEPPEPPQAKADKPPRMVMSPYFGQVMRPGWHANEDLTPETLLRLLHLSELPDWWYFPANNYGFPSPVDYPYVAKPNEYVVGIFGGSVAHSFSMQAHLLFEKLVSERYANGRKVVLLNMAAGGHKQPQQITALSYFAALGQKFDLIVNLDGFNEVWASWYNVTSAHIEPAMPIGILTTEAQNYLANCCVNEEKALQDDLYTKFKIDTRRARARFAIAYAYQDIRSKFFERLIDGHRQSLAGRANRNRSILLEPPSDKNYPEVMDQVADVWFRSSLGMAALSKTIGAEYIHVIQPNQHFPTKKTFSEAERAVAFDPQYPKFSTFVPQTYEKMLAKASALRAAGVRFMDATAAFDDDSEQTYSDGCCHYVQHGYDVLTPKMVEFLVRTRPSAQSASKVN